MYQSIVNIGQPVQNNEKKLLKAMNKLNNIFIMVINSYIFYNMYLNKKVFLDTE